MSETQTDTIDSQNNNNNNNDQIIGIGASAGGLQALEEFFTGFPPHTELSFVVVQHLSPDFKSLMVELLSRCTSLIVERVEHGARVKRGHIYLIPPNKVMTIKGKVLHLTERVKDELTLPIDVFFRSLADDLEEQAVGIILSGTGSDGTQGIRAIKGRAGIVLVQDPKTAKFDGMPVSALSTRLVDYVGSPSELRARLIAWSQNPSLQVSPTPHAGLEGVEEVLAIVQSVYDVDFAEYRPSTVGRRIEKRLQINMINDMARYTRLLRSDPSEVRRLYQDLLIGVTKFFRDDEGFAVFRDLWRQRILELFKNEIRPLRLWSVACSTGEEAYSLAMLTTELLEELDLTVDFKLFATDVDRNALQFASAGVYPESVKADLPPKMVSRYFKRSGDSLVIKDTLRKRVIFAHHNVLRDSPFNRMDMISCRNMLIYFEPPAQQRALSSFAFSLFPGSLLFLGPSETVGETKSVFENLHPRWKLYRRRNTPSPINISMSFAKRPSSQQKDPLGMSTKGPPKEPERYIFKQIMSLFGPPMVIIDDAQQVIMTFGPISEFLSFPVGAMSLDITAMTDDSLGIMLNTAVHRARNEKKRVVYPRVRPKESGPLIDLVVEPLLSDMRPTPIYAVVFQSLKSQEVEDSSVIILPPSQLLSDLQRELQYTRESLQATIEELETSNEELQATNEELLSSNEELQSTNEELQSVNEELITVNYEHQIKIDELVQLNSDMDNFFETSNTWTLFLDRDLAIRKFSPAIGERFQLREGDIGRPLVQFNLSIWYSGFEADLEQVLVTLEPVSREVLARTGEWFLINISPYRTQESQVHGLVLSFLDISRRRQDAVKLEEFRTALSALRAEKKSHGDEESSHRHVLLIEDDPDVVELLQLSLAEHELAETLSVGTSVEESLSILSEHMESDNPVELVLLDLSLPDGSGFKILEYTKSTPELRHIPVVVLSVSDDAVTVRRSYELGASGFVSKPSTTELLPVVLSTLREYWFTVARLPHLQKPTKVAMVSDDG